MQAPPDQYQPVTSFSRTPQFNQILSYLLVTALLVVFFAAIQGNYSNQSIRITMTVLFVSDLTVLVASTVVASKTDPADPVMITYRNGDRSSLLPIINDCLFCDTCRSYVKQTSRHCKICNRCVNQFDHHCAWINNCIGHENYISFFVMIVSAFLYMFFFCLSVGLLWGQKLSEYYKTAIIVSWIFFAVALVFACLILALVSLHIYLSIVGMTTFQFIMQQRAEKQAQEMERPTLHVHKESHNTTEQILNDNKARGNEVVFQANNIDLDNTTEPRNDLQSREQPLHKRQVNPIKQSPETHDNSSELKEVFKQNRSLKYLIGNDVLIRSNHNQQSFQKNYHTIRASRKNETQSKIVANTGILNYVSHNQAQPVFRRRQY